MAGIKSISQNLAKKAAMLPVKATAALGKSAYKRTAQEVGSYVRQFGFIGDVLTGAATGLTSGRSTTGGSRGRENTPVGTDGFGSNTRVERTLSSMSEALASIDGTLKSMLQLQDRKQTEDLYEQERFKRKQQIPALFQPKPTGEKTTSGGLLAALGVIGAAVTAMVSKLSKMLLGGVSSILGILGPSLLKGLGQIFRGIGPAILTNLAKAGLIGAAGYAGFKFGEEVVAPAIDKLVEKMTGVKGETLGTFLYDAIDKLKSVIPGLQSDKEKQRALEVGQTKELMGRRMEQQGGYLSPKQAEFFRGQGIEVEAEKIREGTKESTAPVNLGGVAPAPREQVLRAEEQRKYARGRPDLGGIDFNKYSDTLGGRESGNKYDTENTLGFLGKYQFGADALFDAGLLSKKKPDNITNKEFLSRPENWRPGLSKEEFLKNKALQDQVFASYTKKNFNQLKKRGVIKESDSPSDVAGKLMAAHLGGAGGAEAYFKEGKGFKDAFGTDISKYYDIGKQSQAAPSFEPPTSTTPSAVMAKGAEVNNAAATPRGPTNVNVINSPTVAPVIAGGQGGGMTGGGIPPGIETSMMDSSMYDFHMLTHYLAP